MESRWNDGAGWGRAHFFVSFVHHPPTRCTPAATSAGALLPRRVVWIAAGSVNIVVVTSVAYTGVERGAKLAGGSAEV